MTVRLEIGWRPGLSDAEGEALRRKAQEYCGLALDRVQVLRLLMLDLELSPAELSAIRTEVFTNPVTQVSSYTPLAREFDWALWVGFRPGVRDNAGATAREAIEAFIGRNLPPKDAVYTSKLYLLQAPHLSRDQAARLARELLANDLIQEFRLFSRADWDPEQGVGIIVPRVHLEHQPNVAVFPIDSLETLRRLSAERHLYLRDQDLPIIRDYFQRPEVLARRAQVGLGPPTDVELEYLAQARSDHCNHNTFRGRFAYRDVVTGENFLLDNPFKVCIEAPTREIARKKPWVVSVLKDNAGVGQFDTNSCFVIKGETHNSPSNLEAYGGSLTGIVGVYRDPLGTGRGAKLIAGLYGYCVGPRDYAGPLRPRLHPRRLLDGVIEGVKDGGNKSGVPTINGALYFDARYLGKCLVFVGALGLMPREVAGASGARKMARPGDLVLMCGGRVGMDGIHGVTASSEVSSAGTPAGHVQIGDPYTQKKMHDFLLEARDLGYINFITDCGGGGLSSAVGESGQQAGGVEVWLEKIPLKYAGLDPWEIWVSESQERMVVGLAPENRQAFEDLARRHEVEVSVIARFTNRGLLEVSFDGRPCAQIDLSFLEEDFPPWEFEAEWLPPELRLTEPVLGEAADHKEMLLAMLARPNICSREWITRQYDHEVQGMSVLKPLTGRDCPVPVDAAVLRPDLAGQRGLTVALAVNPAYSQIDAYHMTTVTIDEAVRRLVAVGGDLDTLGGVDNFCWPSIEYHPDQNPDGKFKAAQLVRACQALKEMCLAYDMPLLSGKDSMYVDGVLPGRFGETHRVSGLATLFFTAISVIPDLTKVVNLDFKTPGDLVYLVGATHPELGGSECYEMLGYVGRKVPQVHPEEFFSCYRALSRAITEEILASCHGLYRGGLGVHLALCSLAGGLGVDADLGDVLADHPTHAALYSESAGRFLVTVAPAQQRQFEDILRGHPYHLLGEVRPTRTFTLKRQGRTLLTATLDELKEAWTRPFGTLI
jgi:phosphoribosylformylglycinamidine synthase II|uniref:Phosphoribosylformylglycinamidine synthase subunit PurL n=1 Tax=Desulfobacca acetoxidans TaxID=60893 RepID=A0A7V6A3F0_9BACT